jgi:hypothetical protein
MQSQQFQQLHKNNDPSNPYPIVMQQPMPQPMQQMQYQQPMYQPMPQMQRPMYQPMPQMQYQQSYQPMYQPTSQLMPQMQQEQSWSWRRMPKWQRIIGAVIITVILALLLYNYGCQIPILNIICVIGKLIGKVLSPIGSLLGI